MKTQFPYIFDLFYDCKTEDQVLREIKYLKSRIKRLKQLEELWKEYKNTPLSQRSKSWKRK